VTITYDRASALAHEDWQFLTWEHPMVREAMEMLLEGENGNSCAIAVRHKELASNSIYLELLFILECPAPRELQAGRFLPPTMIRRLIDQKLAEQSLLLTPDFINKNQIMLDKNILRKLISPLRTRIHGMLQQGEQAADGLREKLIVDAIKNMQEIYSAEIERLDSLHQVNPNIKPEDVQVLQQQRAALEMHMHASRVRLDAVRLVVAV